MKGKLIFKHGTMHSSKSAQLIMEAYGLKMQGRDVFSIKPKTDTRGEYGFITSRTPLNPIECFMIDDNLDLYELIADTPMKDRIIMVDEAQFLTKKQVEQLYRLKLEYGTTIIAYGLKNSYIPGELFEGSSALLYYADEIEEIKTICQKCNKKATQNLRLVDGNPVYDGEQIKIGDVTGKESYAQVCGDHFFDPNKEEYNG